MTDRFRLSVVIPNYNHGKKIGRAIEAVAEQSRQPDELLILDDGSTDDSLAVIERYAQRHGFIRVLRHERNLGALAASHRLFEESTGSHVYSAGADDVVLPGFFEGAAHLAAAHPGAGVIFGGVRAVDEEGRTVHHFGVPDWKEPGFISPLRFAEEYLGRLPAGHSQSAATIYRRAAYYELGGLPLELGAWADTFLIQALALKHGAGYLPWDCASPTTIETTFSGGFVRDLDAVERVVLSASRLMASEPFSSLFPPGHAARWSREFRRALAERALWRVQLDLMERQARLSKGLVHWGALAGPLTWFAKRFLRLQARATHRRVVDRLTALDWPLPQPVREHPNRPTRNT